MRKVEMRLRERIKALEAEKAAIQKDRDIFRSYWSGKLRWFIELQGKGEHVSTPWMIEDLAKLYSRVSHWYW